MKNINAMNDEQLEEVVGGLVQEFISSEDTNRKANLICDDMTAPLLALGMTPAQLFALSDEEKQKVIAELGLSSNFDVAHNFLATGHGMKEFQ